MSKIPGSGNPIIRFQSYLCVRVLISVWVRGEIDSRSKLVSCEELEDCHACRAICLNDCTDPENSQKSKFGRGRPKGTTKGQTILVPKDQVVASKAFKADILFGKTRSQAKEGTGGNEPVLEGTILIPRKF